MISRKNRFRHRLAVQAIYRNSKTIRGNMITLKYTLKPTQPWRSAVVVSKKVSKSAVTRNRIRRRIFEIIRKNQNIIPGGSQMIFSVFDQRFADIDHKDLEASILRLIKSIK